MMPVDELPMRASRKPARAVAQQQCAFDGGRNRAGLAAAKVREMEAALTAKHRQTPLSTYRNPMATLPNGAKVAPTANGGTLYHGTYKIEPQQAFANGLAGRGESTDLLAHSMQDP
ncbi:MAG: hypothetical protein KBG15_24520, partial [Kofleriaceae bacterium]|nr:hypothetical protein [Kofleriaceae bacterium]